MPAFLSDLRDNTKTVRIHLAKDNDLNITFYPDRLTQDVIDRFGDASRDKDYDAAAAAFAEVIAEWDMLDRPDGEPLPFDGETFRLVSTRVFNAIWDQINEAVTPKSRTRNGR